MKIFKYNLHRGEKEGQIGVADIPKTFILTAETVRMPKARPDISWTVLSGASGFKGALMSFDSPVCFCTGKNEAEIWTWYILLPAKHEVSGLELPVEEVKRRREVTRLEKYADANREEYRGKIRTFNGRLVSPGHFVAYDHIGNPILATYV